MRHAFIALLVFASAAAWGQKNRPVITGQKPLSTDENTPITIELTDLEVTDRDDWFYPWGFTLDVHHGDNYTVSENTVTPKNNFTGTLYVKVTVNDGESNSEPYLLKIEVTPVNDPPVITGQVSLSMASQTSIQLGLDQLMVTDSDDPYPTGFTLIVTPGANYTYNGTTVTPANNFTGTLTVNIKVNDGHSDSDPYGLKIEVSDKVHITAQRSLAVDEDTSYGLLLSDLVVSDPKNTYPTGFTINIAGGENYTVSASTITPAADFNGILSVSVTVSNGQDTSPSYNLQLTVSPINDAPRGIDLETSPITYTLGNEGTPISSTFRVEDVDDTEMVLAEIGFRSDTYVQGGDLLIFTNTPEIRGVFDSNEGILSLIGAATLENYQQAIRAVTYQYNNEVDLQSQTKMIYIKLNDGENVSEVYEREIRMGEVIELSIPNAFTPNADQANDTWDIVPLKKTDRLQNATVRVYNKRGMMVYEGKGFDKGWDGNMHGQLLPADTYYYTIDLNLSTTSTKFQGSVTILR